MNEKQSFKRKMFKCVTLCIQTLETLWFVTLGLTDLRLDSTEQLQWAAVLHVFAQMFC